MANEEQMSRVPLPDELLAIIAQRYGLSLGQARQLDGGDECLVWSVPSQQGPLVVRSSPCWRSPERLAWTHRLMLSLQAVLLQVIAPLRALDGSTLFRYNDRSVALFPYVAGAPFDRENPKLRQEAATFLARLHATLLNRAPNSVGLQRHLLIGAPPLPPAPDPDSLIDRQLDPMPKGRGLHLDSTATHCTSQGAVLWLRCPTHQGVLTRHPCWPSLAGPTAFAS